MNFYSLFLVSGERFHFSWDDCPDSFAALVDVVYGLAFDRSCAFTKDHAEMVLKVAERARV